MAHATRAAISPSEDASYQLTSSRESACNGNLNCILPARHAREPKGEIKKLQLTGGFEPCIFFSARMLWRIHLFPGRVRVAVVLIDAIVANQNARHIFRQAFQFQIDGCAEQACIFILVIPDHYGHPAARKSESLMRR